LYKLTRLIIHAITAHLNFIPHRRLTHSTDRENPSRAQRAAAGGLPLTDFFGCAFMCGVMGIKIPLSRSPFHEWKGVGGIG